MIVGCGERGTSADGGRGAVALATGPPPCARPRIGEQVMECFSPNLMKKQTHLHLGQPEGEYIFSKLSFLAAVGCRRLWVESIHPREDTPILWNSMSYYLTSSSQNQ